MKKVLSSLLATSFVVTNIGLSAITASAAEETTFTAVVNVYNEETNEPVKGIDVKFVEYDADLPTIPEPQADIVQVLSEWNTSDTNPYEIPDVAFVKGHFYAVQIDNIPEGYCYSWEDHVVTGIHGNGTLTGTINYNIALQPHNPLPKVEYPLDIEREFTFSVVDKSTNQVIEGLDVELAKMELDANVVNKYNYVETVDSWTTAADSYAITIPITYDTYDSPSAVYGIKINNMPEGYTYYQEPEDGYTVCGYYGAYDYRYDLYKDNKTTECIAYIYPEGKPHVYTSTKISDNTTTTTTTTTTAVIEQITDIDQIREMLTEFIAKNELDAKVVSNKEYPGYQPIVIEYDSEKAANMAILEYTQGNNIDTSNVGFVPIVEGVAVTTVNPDSTTTTTTTTTTTVPDADNPNTTTTAVFDYSTFLEYDSSPMKVGETRTVRFYNPELKAMTNMNAYEVSENISYSYEEGSDTLTITALAPGKARMYIMGEGCAFGCYLNIEVVDDSSATAPINNDGTEELPQTGYSNIYKVIAGLAALMTVSGAALVVKTRKENE